MIEKTEIQRLRELNKIVSDGLELSRRQIDELAAEIEHLGPRAERAERFIAETNAERRQMRELNAELQKERLQLRAEIERLQRSEAFHIEACAAHQRHIDELQHERDRYRAAAQQRSGIVQAETMLDQWIDDTGEGTK